MPKKKGGGSLKLKIFAMVIMVALLGSYAFIFFARPNNNIATPAISSFQHEAWMSYLPQNVSEFKYLNITELMNFKDLFASSSILSIPYPQIQVNISEVTFGVDLVANNSLVAILGVGQSTLDRVSSILAQSNSSREAYNNSTLYKIMPSTGSTQTVAWISVADSAILYSEGDVIANGAIKLIIGAKANEFFNNDSYKIGYLLVSTSQEPFALSYAMEEANTLNVTWDMRGASGTTQITKHEAYFFESRAVAESKYDLISKQVLSNANSVLIGDGFILGLFSYSSSDIHTVLANF